jgi:hypothetical protein
MAFGACVINNSGVNRTVGTILEYIEIRIADRHHVFHRNNIQRESVV